MDEEITVKELEEKFWGRISDALETTKDLEIHDFLLDIFLEMGTKKGRMFERHHSFATNGRYDPKKPIEEILEYVKEKRILEEISVLASLVYATRVIETEQGTFEEKSKRLLWETVKDIPVEEPFFGSVFYISPEQKQESKDRTRRQYLYSERSELTKKVKKHLMQMMTGELLKGTIKRPTIQRARMKLKGSRINKTREARFCIPTVRIKR